MKLVNWIALTCRKHGYSLLEYSREYREYSQRWSLATAAVIRGQEYVPPHRHTQQSPSSWASCKGKQSLPAVMPGGARCEFS